MKPTIKIVCKKNQLRDGLFPIYLRVTLNRKSKFYTTPYKCKLNEWNEKKGEFNSKFRNHLSFNSSLRKLVDEATDIFEKIKREIDTITLVQFDNYYRNPVNTESLFIEFFELQISMMRDNGQISYMESLQDSINALTKYTKKIVEYKFVDVDYEFLNNFENSMRRNGANDGGISVHMRNIRMIYNRAIKSKIVSASLYPFSDYKISKLKKQKIKKALSTQELEKVLAFNIDSLPSAKNALFTYLFSYYARGMNFTDIAELKWSDIEENKFSYSRRKTKVKIKILLPNHDVVDKIIEFYRLFNIYDTEYIFPILKKDATSYTEEELNNRKSSVRKYYNKELKRLLILCGIEKNITFYTARHTFATNAMRSGVNVNIIKQALGHKSIKTTENYLDDFADNEVDKQIDLIF